MQAAGLREPEAPAPELPILVSAAEARAVLGVAASTWARLLRERRFHDAVIQGPHALYLTREILAYRRSADRGLGRGGKCHEGSGAAIENKGICRVTGTANRHWFGGNRRERQ